MAKEKDILEERRSLRENPCGVPEGYFAGLEKRLSRIPEEDAEDKAPTGIRRIAPYAALVASFVAIFFFGTLILRSTAGVGAGSGVADSMTDTAVAVRAHEEPSYDESSSDEEAIENYLIANGTSAELLAYSAYEEGY